MCVFAHYINEQKQWCCRRRGGGYNTHQTLFIAPIVVYREKKIKNKTYWRRHILLVLNERALAAVIDSSAVATKFVSVQLEINRYTPYNSHCCRRQQQQQRRRRQHWAQPTTISTHTATTAAIDLKLIKMRPKWRTMLDRCECVNLFSIIDPLSANNNSHDDLFVFFWKKFFFNQKMNQRQQQQHSRCKFNSDVDDDDDNNAAFWSKNIMSFFVCYN